MILDTPFKQLAAVFLLSMVPVIELRGAVPAAMLYDFPWEVAYLVTVVGNMVPVPFIILFARKIINWMKRWEKLRTLAHKLEQKAHRNSKKLERFRWLGLCFLVAIPLPGTGAWTGALVASVLQMRLRDAISAIGVGCMIAGIIVTLISYGILG